MEFITEYLEELAEKTAEASKENEGDYIGEDGLLYCCKCHTPKNYRLPPEFATCTPTGFINVLCACEVERNRREQERENSVQEQFVSKLHVRERRAKCFTDDFYKKMTFAADKGTAPEAIQAAHYYVDNFEKLAAENMGLMLLGYVGTGKTFAACCIANALIEKGYSAWAVTASDLLRAAGNFNTSEETFDRLRNVDLLIVDDIGTQFNSEYNLGLLFDVVDKRYKAGKPLVITSNLSTNDLRNAPNLSLQRIYDRLIEMCTCPISPVVLNGQSLRANIGRAKFNSFGA